jgi:hypothetical protein
LTLSRRLFSCPHGTIKWMAVYPDPVGSRRLPDQYF